MNKKHQAEYRVILAGVEVTLRKVAKALAEINENLDYEDLESQEDELRKRLRLAKAAVRLGKRHLNARGGMPSRPDYLDQPTKSYRCPECSHPVDPDDEEHDCDAHPDEDDE